MNFLLMISINRHDLFYDDINFCYTGHVALMELSRNEYRVLVGRPEGKRPLGRPRRRWEDNIKIYLREVVCDAGD